MLSGYRGFLRELARTGTWRAFTLQVRTGATHVACRLLRRGEGDPIERFLANYGADGFRLPDPARARLQLAAEACLACGLCTIECARAGGAPALDPRDAVLSAARLEIDWIRLGRGGPGADSESYDRAASGVARDDRVASGVARVDRVASGVARDDRAASGVARGGCAACAACEPICPVAIPIAAVQEMLVHLGAAGVATPGGIR